MRNHKNLQVVIYAGPFNQIKLTHVFYGSPLFFAPIQHLGAVQTCMRINRYDPDSPQSHNHHIQLKEYK